MTQITIIAVGKIKEKFITLGIEEYMKRLTRYAKVNLVEVTDEKIPEKIRESEINIIKAKEGKRILSKVPPNNYKIILAIEGDMLSSEQVAKEITTLETKGISKFCFIIGGSLGICDKILAEADRKLSFSKMTFPHQLMRLILMEQLYRAFAIKNNSSYHK